MSEEQKDKNEKLEQCEKEREEYLNGWKRAKADLINYQKDEAKRFEEIVKFANAAMIKDLISVLDSFDLALSSLEKDGLNAKASPELSRSESSREKSEKGIHLIKSQLEEVMKNNGVTKMTVEIGASFDPNLHESIGETESEKPPGTIAEEVGCGYLLNSKVIRPARVKLSKGK